MNEAPLLQVSGMQTVFNRRLRRPLPAVNDFSLELSAGSSVAIVGESGSGKSVSMRSLLQLLPKNGRVTAGTALYHGTDLLTMSPGAIREVRGRHIGVVFQNAMEALNPTLTLGHQLGEALRWHGLASRSQARAKAVEALADVGIPEPGKRVNDYPFQFSGGMRQRAMIAMAIIAEPDVLIADEPTTALDVTVQKQILDLLKNLRRDRDMSLVMITHDLGVARYMCDDAIVMQHGDIVEKGSLQRILTAPDHPYTRRLVSASVEVEDVAAQAPPDADMGADGAGSVSGTTPARADAEPPAALDVSHLRKSFRSRSGTVQAVDDVSFRIEPGQTLGLVGESGSGKSTVARLVMGLQDLDDGTVSLAGQDLASLPERQQRAARLRMQMVFQNPYGSLLPHYTAGANVREALRLQKIGDDQERQAKAVRMLEMVGLSAEDAERYPQQFSGGQQQRIAIARALITDPQILVCDEPTSALDTSIQAQVLDLLRSLQAELGFSVLLISHNLAVVQSMADSVAVMKSGHLVEIGTTDQIYGDPQDPYTRCLLEAVLPVREDASAQTTRPLEVPL
jgi:peptide/nickel transport system ATP-binding protein